MTAAPDPPMTLAQTIVLLCLSRYEWPKLYPPSTRQALARNGWINRDRSINDAGRVALAASSFLEQAQRTLDRDEPEPVATGYRSDSVKRSVRK